MKGGSHLSRPLGRDGGPENTFNAKNLSENPVVKGVDDLRRSIDGLTPQFGGTYQADV